MLVRDFQTSYSFLIILHEFSFYSPEGEFLSDKEENKFD